MKDVKNIFSFSDIHGDIMALIILLRDCAQVIRVNYKRKIPEKKDFSEKYLEMNDNFLYNKNPFDYWLDNELQKNYDDANYDHSLGYEWCGNNSYVVIVGDMIDSYRPDYTLTDSDESKYGEYSAEEFKILMFINEINEQAKKKGGKIVKCSGNHEFLPMTGSNGYDVYISKKSMETIPDRKTTFEYNNFGYKLLMKDTLHVIYKIRDFVFVHGGLTYIKELKNDFTIDAMQKSFIEFIKNKGNIKNPVIDYRNNQSLLMTRREGYPGNDEEKFHDHLMDIYKKFCKHVVEKNYKNGCVEKIRLVVGHCPQNYNITGSTLEHVDSMDEIRSVIGFPITKKETYDENNYNVDGYPIIGITAECFEKKNKNNILERKCDVNNKPKMYRVDVGVSRAFDSINMLNMDVDQLRKAFLRKLPQVLYIKYDNNNNYNVKILRSRLSNMLIHQKRDWLSDENLNALMYDNNESEKYNEFRGGSNTFKNIIEIFKNNKNNVILKNINENNDFNFIKTIYKMTFYKLFYFNETNFIPMYKFTFPSKVVNFTINKFTFSTNFTKIFNLCAIIISENNNAKRYFFCTYDGENDGEMTTAR